MNWINIDKSKPELGIAVLIHLKSDYISIGYRKEVDNKVFWQVFGDIIETINNTDEITHWMPLPEIPNK